MKISAITSKEKIKITLAKKSHKTKVSFMGTLLPVRALTISVGNTSIDEQKSSCVLLEIPRRHIDLSILDEEEDL